MSTKEVSQINKLNLVSDPFIFRGAQKSPFLAPRGVCLSKGRMMVTDTGQNRVFVWNTIPEGEWKDPDLILGQQAAEETGRNGGGETGPDTLHYPSGVWSDGTKLIVADAWNHRVLIWHSFPTQSGQAADVVLGQAHFSGSEPNIQGLGSAPTASSMYWPYGVHSDGTSLWIADTGNRRILYWQDIPFELNQPADEVIGKATFTERDYDHQDAIWPYSVKIGPRGQMAITDTQYYRVLYWNHWKDALSEKAHFIFGQPNLEANGANQFGWFPKANTLNWCYDTCFFQTGLWVADTGNSRVLWFDREPDKNAPEAVGLVGQKNFETGSENPETIKTTEGSLYWPFSISIAGNRMALADTGNHRIVLYDIIL